MCISCVGMRRYGPCPLSSPPDDKYRSSIVTKVCANRTISRVHAARGEIIVISACPRTDFCQVGLNAVSIVAHGAMLRANVTRLFDAGVWQNLANVGYIKKSRKPPSRPFMRPLENANLISDRNTPLNQCLAMPKNKSVTR